MSPLRVGVQGSWTSERRAWGIELRAASAPGAAFVIATWPAPSDKALARLKTDPLTAFAKPENVAHPELKVAGLTVRATTFSSGASSVLHATLRHPQRGTWVAQCEVPASTKDAKKLLEDARKTIASALVVDALDATVDDDELVIPDGGPG